MWLYEPFKFFLMWIGTKIALHALYTCTHKKKDLVNECNLF